jgi:hypothetical protein
VTRAVPGGTATGLRRGVHYVLDGLLRNGLDLPITEHATDTHGASLANFALFDLVGKQLSPRIRDLGKITLYRVGPKADLTDRYPHAGPLLTRRLNTDLITATWDDLLRVAASVKYGHATAALVVGKLCWSKKQQNALSSAIKEYGGQRAPRPGAQEAQPHHHLRRQRTGHRLAQGDAVEKVLAGQPGTAFDQFALHVADRGDGAAEAPGAQTEEVAQELTGAAGRSRPPVSTRRWAGRSRSDALGRADVAGAPGVEGVVDEAGSRRRWSSGSTSRPPIPISATPRPAGSLSRSSSMSAACTIRASRTRAASPSRWYSRIRTSNVHRPPRWV